MAQEPHKRLDDALSDRRLDLGMRWNQVAQAAGVSPEALRAIRRGSYRPSPDTARALDNALRWEPGSVQAVLDGGEPTPQGQVVRIGPAFEEQPEPPRASREQELRDKFEVTVWEEHKSDPPLAWRLIFAYRDALLHRERDVILDAIERAEQERKRE